MLFLTVFLSFYGMAYAWTGKVSGLTGPARVASVASGNISKVMTVGSIPTIVAVEYINNGKVYTSFDKGATWTTATISGMAAGQNAWGVAVARDTGYIVMQPNGNAQEGVWFSKNHGVSFTENTTYTAQYKLAVCAPGGDILYAAGGNGNRIVYTSDGGTNVSQWTSLDDNMYDMTASTDGVYIARARAQTSVQVKYSTNSGGSFSTSGGTIPANGMYSIAMSSNGAYIFGAPVNSTSHMYISTDYGATFSNSGFTDATAATGWVRCSSSGQYVLLGAGNKIYINNNYGNSANWTEVMSGITTKYAAGSQNVSPSGKYMVSGDPSVNGTYYLSEDYGVTWATKTITGCTQKIRGIAVTD